MLFNSGGVVLVLPFLPVIARALERVIPDTSAAQPEAAGAPAPG
jgi:hypothetical protein